VHLPNFRLWNTQLLQYFDGLTLLIGIGIQEGSFTYKKFAPEIWDTGPNKRNSARLPEPKTDGIALINVILMSFASSNNYNY